MRTRLLLVLALGAWGCGQQSLTPGMGTGGTGDCGPNEGKLTCPGPCSDVDVAPICLNGSWTCPTFGIACPLCQGTIPRGCTCDAETGLLTCAVDASTIDADGAGLADAAVSCPPLGPDAGIVACTSSCDTDVALPGVCIAGHWECPRGAFSTADCPTCSLSPPPPGCMCDPTSGALTCDRDAGAAAPDGHGG